MHLLRRRSAVPRHGPTVHGTGGTRRKAEEIIAATVPLLLLISPARFGGQHLQFRPPLFASCGKHSGKDEPGNKSSYCKSGKFARPVSELSSSPRSSASRYVALPPEWPREPLVLELPRSGVSTPMVSSSLACGAFPPSPLLEPDVLPAPTALFFKPGSIGSPLAPLALITANAMAPLYVRLESCNA
jgi:hypothetical protein